MTVIELIQNLQRYVDWGYGDWTVKVHNGFDYKSATCSFSDIDVGFDGKLEEIHIWENN